MGGRAVALVLRRGAGLTGFAGRLVLEDKRIVLEDKRIPDVGPLDALIKVTTTTICGTDLTIPLGAFAAGLGDHQIVTSLCLAARWQRIGRAR